MTFPPSEHTPTWPCACLINSPLLQAQCTQAIGNGVHEGLDPSSYTPAVASSRLCACPFSFPQADGKKRMKALGKVEIPQEAFMAVLKIDRDAKDE